MKTHGLILSRTLVTISLLATLCVLGCKQEEPPFQWGGGGGGSSSDDDDDDAGIPDETWAVARVEVTRSDAEGTTGAVIRAVASWFPHQRVEMRPEPPNDVDTCHGGSSSSGQYMIPDSTWDIGNMSLVMADDEYGLGFEDGYFQDILPYTSWTPNNEFDIRTSGGPDMPATEFVGALGTPPSIAINSVDQSGGQVTVEWLGGDDLNQITILVTRSSGDSLFWVSCRVQDDGEFTLSAGDLEVLPEGTALLDVRREMRADIEIDSLPGVVIGISSASAGISISAGGDDDDSAP
jgi:hypothetical protein